MSKRCKALLSLAELTATDAQPGRVSWIGLRPARYAALLCVDTGELDEAGLVGDHARAGKRAVTLFQAEHMPVLAGFLGRQAIDPADPRRNIHVQGLNLSALRGATIKIGRALVEITIPCAPCSRMTATFGAGGYNALRGHGGWCATVVQGGTIRMGDTVQRVERD